MKMNSGLGITWQEFQNQQNAPVRVLTPAQREAQKARLAALLAAQKLRATGDKLDYSALPPINATPVVTTTTGTPINTTPPVAIPQTQDLPTPVYTSQTVTSNAPVASPIGQPVSTVPTGQTDYGAIFEAAKATDSPSAAVNTNNTAANSTAPKTSDNSSGLWIALIALPLLLGNN